MLTISHALLSRYPTLIFSLSSCVTEIITEKLHAGVVKKIRAIINSRKELRIKAVLK